MEPRRKQVEVVPYNPDWPRLFEIEKALIESVLENNCLAVHHIGSTAVPGLAAKPKLDIIAVIKNRHQVIPSLSRVDFDFRGEWNIPFKMGFAKRGVIDVNLHVFEEGDSEIKLNLLFRDYLRSHPEACAEYAALKYALVQEDSSHYKTSSAFPVYSLRKHALISKILNEAGFDGLRLLFCAHYEDWDAYHRIRDEQIFDRNEVLYDKNHSSFTAENHYHFVLCKGTQVVSVAHVEFLNEREAALRSLATDEPYKKQGYAKRLMELLERWIVLQGRETIKLHSALEAEAFYRKLGYVDIEFDDPCIAPQFVNLGKKFRLSSLQDPS